MPVSLTVTRGKTWQDGEPVTTAGLNLAAVPQISIPDNAIGPASLQLTPILDALKPGLTGVNFLPWGCFAPGAWLASPAVVPAAQVSPLMPGWTLAPAGGAGATATRYAGTPPGSPTTAYAMQINGSAGLSYVDLITRLPDEASAVLKGKAIVLSAWVQNLTASVLTPALYISTRNAPGGTAQTQVSGPVASAVSVGSTLWARCYWVIDTSALPNWANGVEFSIRLPGAVLDDISKACIIAQVQLEIGTTPSPYIYTAPENVMLYPGGGKLFGRYALGYGDMEQVTVQTPLVYDATGLKLDMAAFPIAPGGALSVVAGQLTAAKGPAILERSAMGAVTANTTALTVLETFTPATPAGTVVAGDTLVIDWAAKVVNTVGSNQTIPFILQESGLVWMALASPVCAAGNTVVQGQITLQYVANGAALDIAHAWSVTRAATVPTPGTAVSGSAVVHHMDQHTKAGVTPGPLEITATMPVANANLSVQLVDWTVTRIR